MANESNTTPLKVGTRLQNQLWLELLAIAEAHEQTVSVVRRRQLKAQYDAIAALLFADTGRDKGIRAGINEVWKNRGDA